MKSRRVNHSYKTNLRKRHEQAWYEIGKTIKEKGVSGFVNDFHFH